MYILDSTKRSLKLIKSEQTPQFPKPLTFATSYILLGGQTFLPHTQIGTYSYTDGTVSILNGPILSDTVSQLKFFSLYNPNQNPVYMQLQYVNNGDTISTIQRSILHPYETLYYTDGAGWYYNASNDISNLIDHNKLQNIKGSIHGYHLSTQSWAYLKDQNQYVLTSSNVKFNTIKHKDFNSGYDGFGYAISKSDIGLYNAQFDNLRVRGTMDVFQLQINQIRATNGSLWVSDAGKSISSSYSDSKFVLYFDTGSLLPFGLGDIIRSKRWGVSNQTLLSNWDCISHVIGVDYSDAIVTISSPASSDNYTYTDSAISSWQDFSHTISVYGSSWVRVGNTDSVNNADRLGAIYLTSNEQDSPFLDVYDGISTSVQVLNNSDNVKVRIGKLNGIIGQDDDPPNYGLYSNNAYLTGTMSALSGDVGGWIISNNKIYSNGITLSSHATKPWIGIGADKYGNNGIWLGQYDNKSSASFWDSGKGLKFDGQKVLISATNFELTEAGNISASNATFSGKIYANEGGELAGWAIHATQISSSNIILSSTQSAGYGPYLWIGEDTPSLHVTPGIYIGKYQTSSRIYAYSDPNNYLKWQGDKLLIKAANFELDVNGKISASQATIGGTIYATDGQFSGTLVSINGQIAGWNINDNSLSKNNTSIRTQTSSAWQKITNNGLQYDITDTNNTLWIRYKQYYSASKEDSQIKGIWSQDTYGLIENISSSISEDVDGRVILKYTASNLTPSAGQYWSSSCLTPMSAITNQTFTISANRTYYFGVHQITGSNWQIPNRYPPSYSDQLYLLPIFWTSPTKPENLQDSAILFNMDEMVLLYKTGYTTTVNNVFRSFNRTYAATGSFILLQYSSRPQWDGQLGSSIPNISNVQSITMSSIVLDTANAFVQLNDRGLLVYSGPSNYLKFSTQTNSNGTTTSTNIISIDNLILPGGNSYNSIGGGSSGGTNIQGLSSDGQSITATIPIQGTTISAGQFSGNGFILQNSDPTPGYSLTSGAYLGRLPKNSNVAGKSVKQVLQLMLYYAAPALGNLSIGSGSAAGATTSYLQAGQKIGHPCNWTYSATNISNIPSRTGSLSSDNTGWATQNVDLTGGTQNITSTNAIDYPAYSASVNTTSTITLKITPSLGSDITKTATIQWSAYAYMASNGTTTFYSDAGNITNSTTKTALSTINRLGTWIFPAGAAGDYKYIAYPKQWGKIISCKDNGTNLDVPLNDYSGGTQGQPNEITIAMNDINVEYYWYRTSGTIGASSLSVTIT